MKETIIEKMDLVKYLITKHKKNNWKKHYSN